MYCKLLYFLAWFLFVKTQFSLWLSMYIVFIVINYLSIYLSIVMPIKHHFGRNEWLKINITETMHSFCRIVFRKAYISYIMINCNRGSVWLCTSTQKRNYDYFALVASNLL